MSEGDERDERDEEPGPVTFEVIRDSSFGDTAFERELIHVFLTDNDERLARIGAAIRAGDTKRVKDEAHAMKGASGTVGAERLALLARQLEHMGTQSELGGAAARYRALVEEYSRVREALEAHARSLP